MMRRWFQLSLVTLVLSTCGPLHAAPMPGNFAFSIPQFDFAPFTDHQFYVDQISGQYLGQPDTVWLGPDVEAGETIIVGYPEGHGGPNTILKKSTDGGITWSDRLPTPADFAAGENTTAPTLHRFTDPDTGDDRLAIFRTDRSPVRMMFSISEDDGDTWTPFTQQFSDAPGTPNGTSGGSPPKEFIQLPNGTYMTTWYAYLDGSLSGPTGLYYSTTPDGVTWTTPVRYDEPRPPAFANSLPNEPSFALSPDGSQIASLIRVGNGAQHESLFQVSSDDAATWTPLEELPASLTGQRHAVAYAPDGRLLVAFRDRRNFNDNATEGDYVLWVGTFDDILNGTEGQYRVRLLDNLAGAGETGYSGLEVMPDGTIVATTYADLNPGNGSDPDIISVRFTMDDLDLLAEVYTGIVGDINQDGMILGNGTGPFETDDVTAFVEGWRSVTSLLSDSEKHAMGDLNFDGVTDLRDAFILHSALETQGLFFPFEALTAVPEPSTAVMFAVGLVLLVGRHNARHRPRILLKY